MRNRLHEAKIYRAHRLNPLPFYANTKTPAFGEGEIFEYRHRRATDAELTQLFADRACNIGVFTGDGHVVLDIDGAEGLQSVNGMELPSTVTVVRNDEARAHAHFRTTEHLRTLIRPLPGIDILSEDWQVLMPSSTHPDGSDYVFAPRLSLTDLPLATVPRWIVDLCHTHALPDTPVLSYERELVRGTKHIQPKPSVKVRQLGDWHKAVCTFRCLSR